MGGVTGAGKNHGRVAPKHPPRQNQEQIFKLCVVIGTDILQYRLRFGFSLLSILTVFHLNSLTAQVSYEGRVAVEGAN
jgi:hypothetical protein